MISNNQTSLNSSSNIFINFSRVPRIRARKYWAHLSKTLKSCKQHPLQRDEAATIKPTPSRHQSCLHPIIILTTLTQAALSTSTTSQCHRVKATKIASAPQMSKRRFRLCLYTPLKNTIWKKISSLRSISRLIAGSRLRHWLHRWHHFPRAKNHHLKAP